MKAWRFYVYVCGELEAPVYVGKGSGRRATVSAKQRGASATEIARFKRERDAYAFEVKAISELRPTLNKHPGGNGSWVQKKPAPRSPVKEPWEREMAACGSRLYAASMLAAKGILFTPWGRLDWRDGILTPLNDMG